MSLCQQPRASRGQQREYPQAEQPKSPVPDAFLSMSCLLGSLGAIHCPLWASVSSLAFWGDDSQSPSCQNSVTELLQRIQGGGGERSIQAARKKCRRLGSGGAPAGVCPFSASPNPRTADQRLQTAGKHGAGAWWLGSQL